MSLHADLSQEAKQRLASERRKSTIASLVISLLVIGIIFIGLGFFLLPNLYKKTPTIITYSASLQEETEPTQKQVNTQVQRKPSAPSVSTAPVIASTNISAVSIPVPDIAADVPSVEFGDGNDFGDGWSDDAGSGAGGGMFGSANSIPGALKGRLYDLKQSRDGEPIEYDSGTDFAEFAKRAEKRNFTEAAFSKYFQAPNELNLTSLAVAYVSADKGPEYFGAKDTIKPSGWMAVYSGSIAAPANGKFRFRGASDDYLVLNVNNRTNLVACWPGLQEQIAGRWESTPQEGSTASPLGQATLHAGKWLNLNEGEVIDITLAIGERPGGKVGFILEVEQEGVNYRTAEDGRKILPLFTTHAFSEDEMNDIKQKFSGYEIEWENVPVFGMK